MYETEERVYLTDDRDFDHQVKLHMDIGGNGDYYIYTSWVVDTKGTRHQSPWVRFCTSGGCSSSNHPLLMSVVSMYQALGNKKTAISRAEEKADKALEVLERVLQGDISKKEELEEELLDLRLM